MFDSFFCKRLPGRVSHGWANDPFGQNLLGDHRVNCQLIQYITMIYYDYV